MGDFTLRPGRFSLGDFHLRLDPDIAAEIRALRSRPPSLRLRNMFVRPDWKSLREAELNRLLMQPPTPAARPLVPRGAGPSRPRLADFSLALEGLWRVPPVQNGANSLLNQLSGQLQHGWNRASGAEQVLAVTWTGVLAGSALAGVLSNQQARTEVFDFLVDRDIPVPGIDGFTVRLKKRGAEINYDHIAGSGVSIRAAGGVGSGGEPEYEIMMTLDVAHYLRDF